MTGFTQEMLHTHTHTHTFLYFKEKHKILPWNYFANLKKGESLSKFINLSTSQDFAVRLARILGESSLQACNSNPTQLDS